MTVPQSPYRRAAGGTVSGEMSTGSTAPPRDAGPCADVGGVGRRARRQRHPRPVDADAPGVRPGPGRAQGRGEIERTQADLSQDVDALTDKVTPTKIVERRVDRARDSAVRIEEKVMGNDTASTTASSVQDAATTAAGAVQERRFHRRRRRAGGPAGGPTTDLGATRWPPGSSLSAPAGSSRRCCPPAAASRSSPTKPRRSRRGRCNRSCSRWQWKSRRTYGSRRSRPSSR